MVKAPKIPFNVGGPDNVWASLHAKAALNRAKRNTVNMFPLEEGSEDIEQFFEVVMDRTIPQEVVKDAFPDHYRALQWFTSSFPSSARWYVEALLLTPLRVPEIAEVADYDCSPLVIDIYKRAFFSVSPEKRSNNGWMRQYIWTPALEHSTNLYFYDFILKLAACYGGPAVLNTLILPQVMDPKTKSWLRDAVMDQRDRGVLTTSNVYTKLSPEHQIVSQEATCREWQAVQKAADMDGLGTDGMNMLMQAVKKTVKIISSDSEVDNTYRFISEQYADSEIKG